MTLILVLAQILILIYCVGYHWVTQRKNKKIDEEIEELKGECESSDDITYESLKKIIDLFDVKIVNNKKSMKVSRFVIVLNVLIIVITLL